ncbi:MAG: hypothetical protein WAT79_09135 [Saprospiraceae bacterium]
MDTHQQDLKHIRSMMEKSSTFHSLSSLSGISAGIIGLITYYLIQMILDKNSIDYMMGKSTVYPTEVLTQLIGLACLSFFVALLSTFWFTFKKSQSAGITLWSSSTKNVLKSSALPIIIGGLFCLLMLFHQLVYLIAPCMLIFYGLALISSAKYTIKAVLYLGVCQCLLGLLGAFYIPYGLVFWGIGFGLLHILYGAYLYITFK